MTASERHSDDHLRQAFAALGDVPSRARPDPVDPERVWAAVSGELSAEETAALVDRLPGDPDLAAAWRMASALGARPAAAGAGEGAQVISLSRGRAGGAAAALAAATLLTVYSPQPLDPLPDSAYRDAFDGSEIESALPEDEPLRRADLALAWTGAPEGSLFAVQIADEDLNVLHMARSLTEPRYEVPEGALDTLPDGGRILWKVEAQLPDGRRVTSATFIHALRGGP